MKRNLSTLIAALFVVSAAYAQSMEDKPYVTKNFTNASLNALTVETSGGSIAVTGGQSSGFKVDVFVVPNNRNGKNELSREEIEDRLEYYDIKIGTEGSTVVATAKRKSGVKWDNAKGVSIGFKVYTPRAVSANIKTSGGSIKASELKGNIELKTSGGSITLNSLDGDIEAITSGGSVKGDDLKGVINTGTSGGSVRLANVSGSLKASTSAGSVEVTMSRLGEYLELSSSAGSIRVTMPLEKGLDLNLKGNKVSIPLKNFDGNVEKDRVSGKMNGGGIPVTLSASNGSVYVNQ